jgi:hypothetical protein
MAVAGGEWSASRHGRFTPGTHWIGGWVGPKAGLEDTKKRKLLTLPGLELRLRGLPARSQSLYRLRYQNVSYYDIRTAFHVSMCRDDKRKFGSELSLPRYNCIKLALSTSLD